MTTRKRIGMIALGAAFCLLSGGPSIAAVVNPGDEIYFSGAPNRDTTFSGGAFELYDATTQSSWYAFCLEKNENISFGTKYFVESVGPGATNGGVAGGNPDFISSQTAYLYYKYATGGISGLSGAGTGVQQKALQTAFWYLEQEITTPYDQLDALTKTYLGIAGGADGGLYGVLVVNPITSAGGLAQSQLVYVPEPGALMLFGSGLAGLIAYRKKHRTV